MVVHGAYPPSGCPAWCPSGKGNFVDMSTGQARTPSRLEYFAVVGFFIVCSLLVWRIQQTAHVGFGWWVVAAGAVGYVLSDLVSGLVHWGFDTWGSPRTPVLGPTFIVPFRVHHTDPEDITRHGFVATNGHNCLVALPVLVGALVLPETWNLTALVQAFITAMCLGVFGTNQFHKWAHQQKVHPVVDWLQRHHVVLGKEHHAVHHAAPYARHYCITTGWLNGPLDAIGFFRGLEWLISRVTGVRPRADDLGLVAHLDTSAPKPLEVLPEPEAPAKHVA